MVFIIAALVFSCLSSNPLAPYKWQYRIVITSGQGHQDLVDRLTGDRDGANQRKLLLINLDTRQLLPGLHEEGDFYRLVRQHFDIKTDEVLLIGLDGGVKRRQSESLNVAELYDIIDAMPMRRSELRHQK